MEIRSFDGIGPLRFGQTRGSTRDLLGGKFTSFHKDVGTTPTDAHDALGLHLYFDDHDQLEFIETFPPSTPLFKGIAFIGRKVEDVQRELEAMGLKWDQDDVGLQLDSAGIGITTSGSKITSVAIFRSGYYSDQ